MSFNTILGLYKKLVMEYKQVFLFIKGELQNSSENNISCKKGKKKSFWLNGDGQKQLLTTNPTEKQKKYEHNIREYDISC